MFRDEESELSRDKPQISHNHDGQNQTAAHPHLTADRAVHRSRVISAAADGLRLAYRSSGPPSGHAPDPRAPLPMTRHGGAATDRWLDAWSDVLALCEAAGITMIAAFDARFPLTQSLYNWSQDLEMELGNAGHDDPAKLQARITVGEQVMRRFTDCDQLMIENWRQAPAIKARLAGGYCLRAEAQGASPYANICEH